MSVAEIVESRIIGMVQVMEMVPEARVELERMARSFAREPIGTNQRSSSKLSVA